ncbi:MAG: hypothetical protein Q7S35_10190 [Candidatus Limnocylindrales bacterium]|nr:hypothetical protein [Candidatus Limnocylindrales bacterium]
MGDDELDRRLVAASRRLIGLGSALQEGGPWALAARFDHSPEAAWGPREILAHLAEMLPYWLGEAERILDSTGEPALFGRVSTDDLRLAIIERDRTLPLREPVARVQAGIGRWRRRWAELDPASRDRAGVHVTLGGLTVTDIATRFAVGHLEDHLDQLAAALGGDLTPG